MNRIVRSTLDGILSGPINTHLHSKEMPFLILLGVVFVFHVLCYLVTFLRINIIFNSIILLLFQ